MGKHYTVEFVPDHKSVLIHEGATILEAAGQAGIILNSPCGGTGTCGKCLVKLKHEDKEVLACQTTIHSNLQIYLPEQSKYFQQQILEHGVTLNVSASPFFRKQYLKQVPEDPLELRHILSDQIGTTIRFDKACSSKHHYSLNTENGITVVLRNHNQEYIIDSLEEGDTSHILYGLAIDIGTTTVVAHLTDLLSGTILQTVSTGNPQILYGDDVIGRIHFARTETGAASLHNSIMGCLNNLVEKACSNAQIQREHIYDVVAVGNTTMHHLLLKHPVYSLGQAPYVAHSTAAEEHPASDLGLHIHPAGRIYTMPNIAGHVGSDAIAAGVASGLYSEEEQVLLVDIGTNGELILCVNQKYAATSCAAGPALEGARIKFGSRAVPGAIQRIVADGESIDMDIIGGGRPHSICGSGLLDAMAVLLDFGLLDASGKLLGREQALEKVSSNLAARICTFEGQPVFALYPDPATGSPEIVLTQRDIRELQLAKGAIRTGIEMLVKHLSISCQDLNRILLAGAFGNYIQKQSAVRIGLLPSIPYNRIKFIGNAASTGAHQALQNVFFRKIASDLSEKIHFLDLTCHPDFHEIFTDSMLF